MRITFLLVVLLLSACSSSGKAPLDVATTDDTVMDDSMADTQGPETTAADDQTAPPDGASPDVVVPTIETPFGFAGRIQVVALMQEDWEGSGSVGMEFRSAPSPTTQVVVKEEGDCKVLVGAPMMQWNCDPECEWGLEACINGECIPVPPLAPAGTVTVTGLTKPVTLSPNADGTYSSAWELGEDFIPAGATITATATGGATPAFELNATGIEPLVAQPSTWSFTPGEDYQVTWEAGNGNARIQLLINTGWHGSPNLTTIWCETDDDGELTIPAALTEDFPIPSCGECEGSYISRFTRDIVDFGDGPIELFVASQYWFVAWWGAW